MVPILLVGETGELAHLLRCERLAYFVRRTLQPPAGAVDVVIEQSQQVLAFDELTDHRPHGAGIPVVLAEKSTDIADLR